MQANKLGWVGCILIGFTACGTDNADVSVQPHDSSEATLVEDSASIDESLVQMMQSVEFSVDNDLGNSKPGCPPAQGNTKGVGRPCTKGGNQCKGSGAPFCTVDVSSTTRYAFCTKICFSNDQCGPSATCATNPRSPGMKGCVPNACL